MNYAKIVVKDNYEKKGDLVLRSYIRALKKIKSKLLLDGDKAYIYGKIDENGKFHELFTKEIIDYDNYEAASVDEVLGLVYLPLTQIDQIKKIINNVLFGRNIDFDFEISSIEELAQDRTVEFQAYLNFLSRINPYMRLGEEENQEKYNAYNNFQYKINQLKAMRRDIVSKVDYDEYDVSYYHERPRNESYDKEYLIFEIPDKTSRK